MKKFFLKSVIIITFISLLSSFTGFFRESMIASKFGTTYSSDIYVFSTGFTSTIFACIGSAIATIFLPMLSNYIENDSLEARNYFVNNILNIVMIMSIVLMIIGIGFGESIVRIFGPGFVTKYTHKEFLDAVFLTKIMFISLIFTTIINVQSSILQVHNKYVIPAIVPIIQSVMIIIYLMFFNKNFGVDGLIVIVILSTIIQVIVQVPQIKLLNYKYKFVVNFKHKSIIEISKLIVPVFISTSISQVNYIVDKMLTSNLGEGAISTLNYASKINLMFYTIFATSISTVTYSALSSYNSKNDNKNYIKVLLSSLNFIWIILIPATIGMMVLRIPIVGIIFQHGVFDTSSTITTSKVLLFYSPCMIALGMRDVLNRAFYAIHDTKVPAINSTITLILNIVLNIILIRVLGVYGSALATSIANVLTTILLFGNLTMRLKMDLQTLITPFVKILGSSLVMGLVVEVVYKSLFFIFQSKAGYSFFAFIISVFIGMVAYIFIISIINIEEFNQIKNIFKQKLKSIIK